MDDVDVSEGSRPETGEGEKESIARVDVTDFATKQRLIPASMLDSQPRILWCCGRSIDFWVLHIPKWH